MEGPDRVDEPRDRGTKLSCAGSGAGEAGTAQQKGGADAWSGATYERIAEAFRPIHERIVITLAPVAGERFLDLACGTGGVALIAASTGAEVTGLDLSADQLVKARAAADDAGVSIRFDEGDAQSLPYEEGSFEVVASAFGMIFAPDHARAADELARVCGPDARIAITSWTDDEWFELNSRLRPQYEGLPSIRWGEEEYVRGLLSGFELRFERGESTISAASNEECWHLLSASVPPLKAWLDTLGPAERENAGREYKQLLHEGSLTREYVLILGTRR